MTKQVEHKLTIEPAIVTFTKTFWDWWCTCGMFGTTFYPDLRRNKGCPHDDKNLVNKRT